MKNKIYILLVILFSSITSFTQTFGWKWAKSASGILNEEGYCIAADAGGNSYVIGSFLSPSLLFGSITLTNADSTGTTQDIFIVKYGAAGNVVWAKSAGGIDIDRGYGIAVDANGNVYITGSFSSPGIILGGITLTNSGYEDVFIAKYNSSGTVLWARKAGGTGSDIGNAIAVDASGNSYITGVFGSPSIIFGTTTLINIDNSGLTDDIFIAKFDASGNSLWAKSAGGAYNDIANNIKVSANGNSYIAGYFNSHTLFLGGTTLTNVISTGVAYTNDIFIAKYDASGNILWARNDGGSENDEANSMALDINGDVYITGEFADWLPYLGNITIHRSGYGSASIFIIKYDASGNAIWANSSEGSILDQSTGISVTNGNVYLTGYYESNDRTFGGALLTNMGSSDIFVVKYDTSGTRLWDQSAGGSGGDYGNSVASDANGNIYITGLFNSSTLEFGNTILTKPGAGNIEMFIARYGNTTGIASANNSHDPINIFPNPCNGQINITSSNIIDRIEITNTLGQIIYQSKPNEKNISLQLEHDGIYFVTVISNKQTTTKKLVIQQ
jgi:hypothetical protein